MKSLKFMLHGMLIVFMVALIPVISKSQTNLGLTAVSTHGGGGASASGYGPELYNNGVIPTPWDLTGTYTWGWTNTNSWIEYTWTTAQTFNNVIFYKANRPVSTCTFQYWNGSAYVDFYSYSNAYKPPAGTLYCKDSVTFPAITTTKLRFNSLAGSSNPNFMEIEVRSTKTLKTDAGVASLDSPAVALFPGQHLVSVKIRNSGSDTLKSTTIFWSVDGNMQTSVPWVGAIAKNQTSSTITLGNYTFFNGSHNIKVWTSNPNGMVDSNKFNDTLLTPIVVCNLLSGYFVIDQSGGGNYLNISSAIAALSYCGIGGPVTFRIRPGTYAERVVIPFIPGTSSVNRIIFDGGSADSTKISFSKTTSTAYSVVVLNGADFITLKNLTIENTDITYGCGIHFGNKADNNIIENCIINISNTATASAVVPIMGSINEATPTGAGDVGNFNIIRNNRIVGGYYGIRFYGLSSAPYSISNSFINNTIEQFYNYGTYIYYQKNLLFQYNKVIKPRYAYAYGVYGGYNYNSVYDANIINPGAYGLYIYYNQNVDPDSTVVSNNIITNFLNGTYQWGIQLYSSYRIHVLNNSVWCDGTYTTTTSYGCMYYYNLSDKCVIKNNIFKSTGNLPCYINSGSTIAAGNLDYNNYIASSTGNVAYNGTSYYSTLALWKAADGNQNNNSFSVDPIFVSYTDLHLQAASPLMFGNKVGLINDVDGDNRCTISTSIGADEFPFPVIPPQAGFSTADSTCQNTPLNFWNQVSANDITKNSWFVNGQLKSTNLNFSYTPNKTGLDTISLITANCFGSDTFSRTIKVVNPTNTPISGFMASRNRLKVGELARLNDLSTDCPSAWEWKITPDTIIDLVTGIRQPTFTYLNGTSQNSQNPEILFNYSGFYNVTQKTSNSLGTGTTEIKTNYFSVVPSFTMCYGSTVTDETEGYLYDNGGKNGNYIAKKSCTYTINPCAATISLNFLRFSLTSGDYLRIYDGTNNKGVPLWNKKLYPSGMGNAVMASFPSDNDIFTSLSGAIYIEFITDATMEAEGFEAVWTSTPGTFTVPVASFAVADSNCNGSHVFFENTSTGDQNKYFWDFNNNGVFESSDQNPEWIYKTDGNYNVKLVVINCVGSDTAYKKITIYTSLNKPTFDIETSNNRPNMAIETVNLSAFATANCIDTFSWSITPNSYIIKSGSLHDYTFGAIFNDSVCYDITLISGYKGMMDTMFFPCFVRPIEYCIPNFAFVTPDIGISRVRFNDIDQVSEPGKYPFEDFTDTKASLLEHGATYNFCVSRNTNYNYIQRKIWIDYNINGDFNDPGELVANDTLSNSLAWTGSVTIPLNTMIGKSRLRVGVSAINQKFGPCSILYNGEYEDYSVILSQVITPPVITITGSSQINVQECGTYTDPGATALSTLGSSVMVITTGSVDTKVPATYLIKYNATDQFGNKAIEKIRTVIVEPDNVAPSLVLVGKMYDTIVVRNSYTDPGYTAYDICSGMDTTYVNNSLNNNILGSYTITYQSVDKRGNIKNLKRYIEVIDNISPVITVFDPDTIFMEVNTALNPRVLKITDNYYTTFSIVTTGTFYQNFNTGLATSIGIYTIIYDVTDGSGNKASKKFWIKVGDQTSPVITLNGSRIINLCRYDTFAEEGYVVEDNVDAHPKVVRSGSYFTDYLVNYANGTYEIQYTATDNSNNFSYISRLLYVSDSDACASFVIDARKNDFKIYPNPSSGLLNIDLATSENATIQVYDMLGKSVYSKEFRSSKLIQLDLSNVSNGIYNVQIISNGLKRNSNINIIH